jgi:hypothetical protein
MRDRLPEIKSAMMNGELASARVWRELEDELRASFGPIIKDIFVDAATQLDKESVGDIFPVDWTLVNRSAQQFASTYTYSLVKDISRSTQRYISKQIARYFTQGETLGQLQQRIQSNIKPIVDSAGRTISSQARAKKIARTEVTRAAANGEKAVVKQVTDAGIEMVAIWNTSNDALVCPICGPRNGKRTSQTPPAHVNCRCWITYIFKRMAPRG